MKRSWKRIAAILLIALVLPAIVYAGYRYMAQRNEMEESLMTMGFLPIRPPSNLLDLGSIYWIDESVSVFRTICSPSREDVASAIRQSPGEHMVADQLARAAFSAGLKGLSVTSGEAEDQLLRQITFRLYDVNVFEIELGKNWQILQALMARPECSNAATMALAANGYVCQGQSLLQASAEYRVNNKEVTKAALDAGQDPSTVKDAVAQAVKAGSKIDLVEEGSRLTTGKGLKYGIAMAPSCVTPLGARFARTLPKSGFEKFVNFIKFRVIEPLLPSS